MNTYLDDGKTRFSDGSQGHALAGFRDDHVVRSRSAISGGYAFESALCFVESQSPRLRPADMSQGEAKAGIAQRETQELSSRALMLTRLLDGVRGQLDPEEALLLLDAAGRVADELVSVFGPSADAISIDPSATSDQRRAAAKSLMSVWSLQERIRIEQDETDPEQQPQFGTGY